MLIRFVSRLNREIAIVYKKEILEQLTDIVFPALAVSIHEALFAGDGDALKSSIRTLLLESASVYDTVGENFYQGMMLGLCAMMDSRYAIRSNRETGQGRYDISLIPMTNDLPGVLIELKAAGTREHADLKKLRPAADEKQALRY